jgi:predicted dehydrogenase
MTDQAATKPRPRIGVLGSAYWAWWCHGTVLAQRPDVDFVGLWARRRESAQVAVDRIGSGKPFDDFEEFLDNVDVVTIALPPDVQPALAIRAAEAGKHLLLEKPLALDPSAARLVAKSIRTRGVHSLVFLTYLFQPVVQNWLQTMSGLAHKSGPWEGAILTCAGGIGADSPYRDSTWRWERGGLWDLGPHALSVVQALFPPIVAVTGTRGVRDTANVLLTHQGGATSYFSLTVTAPPGAEDSSLVIWGPGGRHRLELPTGMLREAFGRAVDSLLGSVATGANSSRAADDGARVVEILAAAERAIDNKAASHDAEIHSSELNR